MNTWSQKSISVHLRTVTEDVTDQSLRTVVFSWTLLMKWSPARAASSHSSLLLTDGQQNGVKIPALARILALPLTSSVAGGFLLPKWGWWYLLQPIPGGVDEVLYGST